MKINRFESVMKSRSWRNAMVAEETRLRISVQIRAIREQRGLTEKEFGELIGKPQSSVSRLEDSDRGTPNVNTLIEIANALDIPLAIGFVPWSFYAMWRSDISPDALRVKSFE